MAAIWATLLGVGQHDFHGGATESGGWALWGRGEGGASLLGAKSAGRGTGKVTGGSKRRWLARLEGQQTGCGGIPACPALGAEKEQWECGVTSFYVPGASSHAGFTMDPGVAGFPCWRC